MRPLAASRLAAIYLVVTAAGFGGTWVAAPWATDEIATLTVATIRFALAAVLLLGWCVVRGLPLRLRGDDLPVIAAYTVLIPVFGLTLTVGLLGEPLTPLALVGAVIVLVGLRITQTGAAARPRLVGSGRADPLASSNEGA